MYIDLSQNWLDIACSHSTTQWLTLALRSLLPSLLDESISNEEFARRLTELFVSRQLLTPAQQKNARSNVVQALKSIDAEHPAIPLIGLTTEQYRKLNQEQQSRVAQRITQLLKPTIVQALVDRAIALLDSAEWSEVAAGLAVLTGRRVSEILLSEFAVQSAWSLRFREQSKKKGTRQMALEIPTLAPAQQVFNALQRLQEGLKINDLKAASLTSKMARHTVNQRYSALVAARCHARFADLIPPRTHKEKLYTHLFRAVYATIAAHWFCPTTVPEHLFKAEIQGHFTLTDTGEKLPSYGARAHYDDYAIATETGNRDGRLGIRLGTLPDLQVLEVFRSAEAPKPLATPQENVWDSRNTQVSTQSPDSPDSQALDPQRLGKETIQAILQTKTNKNKDNLKQDNSKVEEVDVVSDIDSSIVLQQETDPDSAIPIQRPALWREDVDRMLRLMAQRGVVGTPAQVFHALLLWVETHTQELYPRQDLETIRWFTTEIDRLRATIATLEADRPPLQAESRHTEEIDQLQAENQRLRSELQRTNSQLQGIQQVLGLGIITDSQRSPQDTPDPIEGEPIPPIQSSIQIAQVPSPPVEPAPPRQSPNSGQYSGQARRGDSTLKIHQIIDALIAWNSAQEDPDRMLRISIPPIKAIASAMKANYQPVIQHVLKEREEEIQAVHRRFLLGARHNASVKQKTQILQEIARDYLALENWQEVT